MFTSSFEILCSSLLFLLSKQSKQPHEYYPEAILQHLDWLAEHPDTKQYPTLVKTCERLSKQWSGQLAPTETTCQDETVNSMLH